MIETHDARPRKQCRPRRRCREPGQADAWWKVPGPRPAPARCQRPKGRSPPPKSSSSTANSWQNLESFATAEQSLVRFLSRLMKPEAGWGNRLVDPLEPVGHPLTEPTPGRFGIEHGVIVVSVMDRSHRHDAIVQHPGFASIRTLGGDHRTFPIDQARPKDRFRSGVSAPPRAALCPWSGNQPATPRTGRLVFPRSPRVPPAR